MIWNNVYFVKPVLAGPGVLDYTLHTEEHKCKKDALLGRIKHCLNKSWNLIRPRPTKTQYVGPYYICKGKKKNPKNIDTILEVFISGADTNM